MCYRIKKEGYYDGADNRTSYVDETYVLVCYSGHQNTYTALSPFFIPDLKIPDELVEYTYPNPKDKIEKLLEHKWRYGRVLLTKYQCRSCQSKIPSETLRMISPGGAHYHAECALNLKKVQGFFRWPLVPDFLIKIAKQADATHILGKHGIWNMWKIIHHPTIIGSFTIQTSVIVLSDLTPTPWCFGGYMPPKYALKLADPKPWNASYESDCHDEPENAQEALETLELAKA